MKRLHVGTHATAAGRRADTMLMVHISARHGTVDVVSLPRDSYVTIPAHLSAAGDQVPERRNKLNAAYAYGGPPLTVATIERSTGVRIDHYLEVDFLGFVRLVDAVGGVDVCSPTRLRDRKAGLRLPAGVTHVDGETGLAYVRARHLDARADLGRVERQQRFLAAMVDRATSRDVLLDPRALVRFLDASLAAVRADPGLTEDELVRLGTRLRHVSGRDIRFRTVPVANPSYRAAGAGAVALWDADAAADVFTAMREDTARPHHGAGRDGAGRPTVEPAQIRRAGLQRWRHRGARVARQRRPRGPRLRDRRAGAELEPHRGGPHDDPVRHPLHREHQDGGRRAAGGPPGRGGRAGSHHAGRRRDVVRRGPSRAARGPRGCRHRRPHRGRPRLQLTDPQGVAVSRDWRIAARRASRWARRISASPTRRRSSAVSGSTGGTSRGRPSASTATNTR